MSTATSTPKGKPTKARPAGLPDERFWIKYSQHHELPLSVTSSIFLHAVAFGLIGLVLAGILSGLFGGNKQPVIDTFQMAGGGGGDPNGNTDGATEINVPTGPEVTEKIKNPEPVQPVEPTNPLNKPDPKTEPLVNANETVSRLFQEPTLSPKNLSDVAKKANDRLALAISKGKGGPGTGGGAGGGEGTGIGDKKGPGTGTGTIKHSERQLRWTMIFRTNSGGDYLKQLQDLGATLATPESNDEFLVFRDLHKRPVIGRKEDLGTFQGVLRWIDDRPDSVEALARSMGLRFKPPYIVAFFQPTLESQLRELERQHYKGDESNIEETTFRIESRPGGRYVPTFQNIRLKK